MFIVFHNFLKIMHSEFIFHVFIWEIEITKRKPLKMGIVCPVMESGPLGGAEALSGP